ncbi:hypothetical protein [Nocardiopsis sp. CNT312]|uniref:hypothetical protein n=1 Tax=Nocardiopsis sp. CNT312 TaxID=1137268 RepID=UPI0004BCCC04|nr:hypothetical protein [Nocardiopsis sp. CNT312]
MTVGRTLWAAVLAAALTLAPGAAHAQGDEQQVEVRCERLDSFWSLVVCAATCGEALDKESVTLQECTALQERSR